MVLLLIVIHIRVRQLVLVCILAKSTTLLHKHVPALHQPHTSQAPPAYPAYLHHTGTTAANNAKLVT